MKFELLNIKKETDDDIKIKEFESLVIKYINSKDKFINKDSTLDTHVKNTKNIMGHITKSEYNMTLEGLGLCHIEKKFKYDYSSLFTNGYYICNEDTTIHNIVEDETKPISRIYMVISNYNNNKPRYILIKETIDNTTIDIQYDKLFRVVSQTTFIDNKFNKKEIYEYVDSEDGSFTVEEKKQVSEDTEPVFISKTWVDKRRRIIRIDTATGSSKRTIYDDIKKIKEEFYQNEVLCSTLRYERYKEILDNGDTKIIVTMIRDNYILNKISQSIIIEEREKIVNLDDNRLKLQRVTKYHKGIKLYEKIDTIEYKIRSDGSRTEKQVQSLVDNSKDEPIIENIENIIDFDDDNRVRLIVTIKPNTDTVYSVRDYDDESCNTTIKNNDTDTKIIYFDDDPETIKDLKSKNKYNANVLYNKFNTDLIDFSNRL